MELKINAADLGEPMAQIALGAMYVEGELVGKDMDEARRWYARAAAQGNVYAIDRLRYFGAPH
jgi:TPR repeat protein